MYTINNYRNNLIISPVLWLLLHYKHLWWSNVRWEFVLLSIYVNYTSRAICMYNVHLRIVVYLLSYLHSIHYALYTRVLQFFLNSGSMSIWPGDFKTDFTFLFWVIYFSCNPSLKFDDSYSEVFKRCFFSNLIKRHVLKHWT